MKDTDNFSALKEITSYMRHYILLFSFIICGTCTLPLAAQSVTFVKDSILDHYMDSGIATKKFRPKGKYDEDGRRQGNWKDYEVERTVTYIAENNKPKALWGSFLIYGEGFFEKGERVGVWDLYLIEDKTFKKVLYQRADYDQGEKDGESFWYYPSGKIAFIGELVEGKRNHASIFYYETGEVLQKITYKDDRRVGEQTEFYPDKRIVSVANYVNDSLHGPFTSFYPDGKHKEVSYWKMGKVDSVYKYYYPNGQLWVETTHLEGKTLNVKGSFSDEGTPRDCGTLIDGNGTLKYYTEEGTVYLIRTFKDGEVVDETEVK